MKFLLPLTLALLLAACALTPQEKEAAHQVQLEKEARENFLALKAQQHPNAPPAPAPAPTPAPHLLAFLQPRPAEPPVQPAPAPPPPKRQARAPQPTPKATSSLFAFLEPRPATSASRPAKQPKPTPTPKAQPPQPGETVFFWQVPSQPRNSNLRYQAAEAKYARALAKSPENLTPEERIWAHEHY